MHITNFQEGTLKSKIYLINLKILFIEKNIVILSFFKIPGKEYPTLMVDDVSNNYVKNKTPKIKYFTII